MTRFIICAMLLAIAALGSKVGLNGGAASPPPDSTAAGKPPLHESPIAAAQPAVSRDPVTVFQRAFWRRPDATVRILEGERREWTDGTSAIQKWQWFLAVQTTAEFRRWLLEENPFELIRTDASFDPANLESPPNWFPSSNAQAELTAYRAHGGRFTLFLHAKSGRLFAADSGSGFAADIR
jgi:hypothetical protein